LQEEDLTLHHGMPSKVVLFKFHRTFLWPESWVTKRSRPQYACQALVLCNPTDAIHLPKCSSGDLFSLLLFSSDSLSAAILFWRLYAVEYRLSRHFRPLRQLPCCTPFLQLPLLSFVSVLVCDLPLERVNRVTDAPESTRRLLGHISLQPSSVPIQARQ
jgi:hypothetical protein